MSDQSVVDPDVEEVELLGSLPPSSHPVHDCHHPNQSTHSTGLILKFKTPAGCWVGNFQNGEFGITRVLKVPGTSSLVVVAKGQGYFVPTHSPSQWVLIDAYPLKQIVAVAEPAVVLLATETDLVAYGGVGRLWERERLVWDELRIWKIDGDRVVVRGFDAPSNQLLTYTIDLATGARQ